MANEFVSTKVWKTTLDDLRVIYARDYPRTKESMASILHQAVKAEKTRRELEYLQENKDEIAAQFEAMRNSDLPTYTFEELEAVLDAPTA